MEGGRWGLLLLVMLLMVTWQLHHLLVKRVLVRLRHLPFFCWQSRQRYQTPRLHY
jgi:hypothetical protein